MSAILGNSAASVRLPRLSLRRRTRDSRHHQPLRRHRATAQHALTTSCCRLIGVDGDLGEQHGELPCPLLDRIDAIQRADPWAHEDAVDEGGLDGYADSPPLAGGRRASALRRRTTPSTTRRLDALQPPHAASLARLEQSGLQPSPRVLPGADQVRTPYTQTFRIGPRRPPRRRHSDHDRQSLLPRPRAGVVGLGGISAEQRARGAVPAAPQGAVARDRRRVRRGRAPGHPRALGSLLRDEALSARAPARTVVEDDGQGAASAARARARPTAARATRRSPPRRSRRATAAQGGRGRRHAARPTRRAAADEAHGPSRGGGGGGGRRGGGGGGGSARGRPRRSRSQGAPPKAARAPGGRARCGSGKGAAPPGGANGGARGGGLAAPAPSPSAGTPGRLRPPVSSPAGTPGKLRKANSMTSPGMLRAGGREPSVAEWAAEQVERKRALEAEQRKSEDDAGARSRLSSPPRLRSVRALPVAAAAAAAVAAAAVLAAAVPSTARRQTAIFKWRCCNKA